jgi:hypothetical protein
MHVNRTRRREPALLKSCRSLLVVAGSRLLSVVAIAGTAGCRAQPPSCLPSNDEESVYGETLDAVAETEVGDESSDVYGLPRETRPDVMLRIRRSSAWEGVSVVGIAREDGDRYVAFVRQGAREWRHPLDSVTALGVIARYAALMGAARSGKPERGVYDGTNYLFELPTAGGSTHRAATDSPARCTRASGAAEAAVELAEYAGNASRREAALAALRAFARDGATTVAR